jgi:hypothetical protein
MANRSLTTIVLLAAATAGPSAHAEDFIFDFKSDMVCGTGTLSGVANGDGWLTILGGSLSVFSGVYEGSYKLIGNANKTSPIISPTGYFIYDNQLSPDAPASLNVYGLLFGDGSTEINIWGNGEKSPYTFYAHGKSGDLSTDGEFTIAVVPAPGAVALAGLGAVVFGLRRRRS